MKHLMAAAALVAGLVGFVQSSTAKVVKFEVVRIESPAFEGRSFGAVGTYDRIIARATVAVSPGDAHNAVIVDIDLAPRNAHGKIAFEGGSADELNNNELVRKFYLGL